MASVTKSFKVGIMTFFLSILITALFQLTQTSLVLWVSVGILLFVILMGILFDIVGTAATAANEKPFHALASDKIYGAKKAIELVRHADQVANFCNDVVGDICGTVSGSIGTALVFEFIAKFNFSNIENIITIISIGVISALTVSGKALGKSVAIDQANTIVLKVANFLERVESFFGKGNNKNQNKKPNKKSKN